MPKPGPRKKKGNPANRRKKSTFAQREAKPSRPMPSPEEVIGMRLNKYVAHCGICSRRQAAEYVKEGLVSVNGEVELSPAYQIQKGDVVRYEDKVIQPELRRVYLLLNKPKGYITTVSDDRGRKTVMDLLAGKVKERVFPVGRLDRETTGLLMLTNDGDLAKKLSHPSHNVKKLYHVVLDRSISTEHLQAISDGLDLEDGVVQVDGVNYVQGKSKREVGIEIHLGRNRIVRRIFEHLGYEVKRLDRVYYAGLTKKDLPRGRFRRLTDREIVMLKHFV